MGRSLTRMRKASAKPPLSSQNVTTARSPRSARFCAVTARVEHVRAGRGIADSRATERARGSWPTRGQLELMRHYRNSSSAPIVSASSSGGP